MRSGLIVALLALAAGSGPAGAQPAGPAAAPPPPTWADTPALMAAATAPLADELRACIDGRLPRTLTIVVRRARDGSSIASYPLYGLGGRGPTAEESCLAEVVTRLTLPPLPSASPVSIDQLTLGHRVAAPATAPLAADPAWTEWRDPAAAVAALVDPPARAALARCAPRARTVRVVLDLRRGATRVWLPAWQFHSPGGDGSTPPAERTIKSCLTRAIRTWRPARLPRGLGEIQASFRVSAAAAPAARP